MPINIELLKQFCLLANFQLNARFERAKKCVKLADADQVRKKQRKRKRAKRKPRKRNRDTDHELQVTRRSLNVSFAAM